MGIAIRKPAPSGAFEAAPAESRARNWKLAFGVLLGCGALSVAAVLSFVMAGLGLLIWIVGEPEQINLSVDVPVSVGKGESFAIEITVEDLSGESRLVHSIDIDDSYLEGLEVVRTEPPFTELLRVESLGFRSYYFEKVIEPNSAGTILIALQGLEAGDYTGEIDVCIDSSGSCTTVTTRTVVYESGASR
jgi:hypothetical protein